MQFIENDIKKEIVVLFFVIEIRIIDAILEMLASFFFFWGGARIRNTRYGR